MDEAVGQRIDRLIGLKFPAYLMPHRSKRLWLLHQHRSAYDLWDAPFSDLLHAPDGAHVRSVIHAADDAAFGECEAIYTNSRVVSGRLRRFNGVESEPLHHPPPGADRLRPGPYGDYILFPSRVNESKRQHLAIEAVGPDVRAGPPVLHRRHRRARVRHRPCAPAAPLWGWTSGWSGAAG